MIYRTFPFTLSWFIFILDEACALNYSEKRIAIHTRHSFSLPPYLQIKLYFEEKQSWRHEPTRPHPSRSNMISPVTVWPDRIQIYINQSNLTWADLIYLSRPSHIVLKPARPNFIKLNSPNRSETIHFYQTRPDWNKPTVPNKIDAKPPDPAQAEFSQLQATHYQ